jgi:hypothetical protein
MQDSNAPAPMPESFDALPKFTSESKEQSEKALFPMTESFDGCPKSTSWSEGQSRKAISSMTVTDPGIKTDRKARQESHRERGITEIRVSVVRPRKPNA